MANTILIKRSSTASATPTALQLTAGELAVNTADGCLFTKNSAGAIVNLPVSSISGQTIAPGQVNVDNIQLNDNTLSTTDIDGSLIVSPDGAGKILLGRTTADGTTNVVQCHSLTVRGSDYDGTGNSPSFTSTGATYFGNEFGEVGLLCAIVPAETFDATHPTVYCFTGCNELVSAYKPILFTAGYFAQFWLDPSGYVGIGTASPSATLDVAGSINVSSTLQLSGSTSGFVAFQSPDEPTSHTYTLPSVTGTAGQVLTTDGAGVLSWTAPTVRATITATASQTSFTVSGGYTVGGIDVYLNGIKQVNGDDFTATNGTSITLTQGADAGDILDYVAYGFAVTTGALVKSGDTMTGSLTMSAGTTLTTAGVTKTTVAIGNSSTAQTISITNGTQVTCTLTGNCTFTMPTATAGKSFTLLLKTGAGAFTATFTGVKWPGATPTITATASRMDIINFVADGVNWYGRITQNYTP